MKCSELLSRILVTVAIVGAIGAPLFFWSQTRLLHARIVEDGSWMPNIIKAEVNKPLQLQLTSDDVMHGFAIGQMDMPSVEVAPGKVTHITLTFDKPGTYTFYCTRWCGLNHWRMRGTIEVDGSSSPTVAVAQPLYLSLNLDIDAPHNALQIPTDKPLAVNGEKLISTEDLSPFINTDFYRTHSPYEVFEKLDAKFLTDSQRWDVVAYIWKSNTTPNALANGQKLFNQNCAACHGEQGAGDGVFADDLKAAGAASSVAMPGAPDMARQSPANFTDSQRMLGASPALLQGKILRGGMGTGMPMWGTVFTEQQTWDLIAYLYSFQFDYQGVTR